MDDENRTLRRRLIRSHKDLEVYQRAVQSAMALFEHTKSFPKDEVYSLTSQVRRSSRSVAANIAEAWRKRRYAASFVSKLSDAEAEAAETQVHIEFAVKCGYLTRAEGTARYREYEQLIKTVVGMIIHADKWTLEHPSDRSPARG